MTSNINEFEMWISESDFHKIKVDTYRDDSYLVAYGE